MDQSFWKLPRLFIKLTLGSSCLFCVWAHATTKKEVANLCASALTAIIATPYSGSTAIAPTSDMPPRTPVVRNLPADLRKLFIEAAYSQLFNTRSPEFLYTSEVVAARELIMAGEAPSKVFQNVSTRLEQFIQAGRNIGQRRLLTSADSFFGLAKPPPPSRSNVFHKKYDLEKYKNLTEKLRGEFPNIQAMSEYFSSLQWGMELAEEIGDAKHAREIIVDYLRVGDYINAIGAALKVKDEEAVINVALLAISSVYEQNYSPAMSISLSAALRALGKVTGARRVYAQNLLLDFATEMSSMSFLQMMLPKISHYNGYVKTTADVYRQFEGSILESYILAKAPEIQIQNFVDRMIANQNPNYELIGSALVSIGDFERLKKFSKSIRQRAERQRDDRLYLIAFDFDLQAGDRVGAKSILDAQFEKHKDDVGHLQYTILPLLVKLSDQSGILRLARHFTDRFGQQSPGSPHWRLEEKIENALAGRPLQSVSSQEAPYLDDQSLDPVTRGKLIEQYGMQLHQSKIRRNLTDELKTTHVRDGNAFLLAGDLWSAYLSFNEALDREGLVKVAEAMIRSGTDSNNVSRVILAAALLSPQQPSSSALQSP